MVNINKNFLMLQNNYLFSTINDKVEKYQEGHPDKKVIRLGIGDVTLPLPKCITKAIQDATEEMSVQETFRGYGPEQGYEFLRIKILENDYEEKGIHLDIDEIFVSDGSKCDVGNIVDLFEKDNIVAIPDPVYPVYLDTNVIAGRSGEYDEQIQMYYDIVYMQSSEKNHFEPLPEELKKDVDIIYLCSPNNPTGMAMSKESLKKWVEYAQVHHSIILYDAAYEAFIQDENIPHSIYEIEGAKKVAIEFRSFSKTAGFTGMRCAYTVIPKELKIENVSINQLWNRRNSTKFNGVSYIIQRGAEAVYSEEGKKELRKNIQYYQENARMMKENLSKIGLEVYGGVNAPYIWVKLPDKMKSWDFFNILLEKMQIVGTPGVGFGPSGEGYFRFTSFGNRKDVIEAIKRIRKMKI